jgi:predicted small metal-binding protein
MEGHMLKFECKELGTNCNYVARGNTIEEVKNDALGHVQVVHKYWFAVQPPEKKVEIDKTLTGRIIFH